MRNLSSFLDIAFSKTPSILVSKHSRGMLSPYPIRLPDIYWLGFEIHLNLDSQVDFHQGIRNAPLNLKRFNEFLAAHENIDCRDKLIKFATHWATRDSAFAKGIAYIVLEFDVDEQLQNLTPGIFIAFQKQLSTQQRLFLTQTILALFDRNSVTTVNNVEQCFNQCKGKEKISHIALMLSRDLDAVRLNVRELTNKRLSTYLDSIGYVNNTNNILRYFTNAVRYVDTLTVCLDVGKTIDPRVGLECALKSQPSNDARYKHFLDFLVTDGLCSPNKAEALRDCESISYPPQFSQLWPEGLIAESICLPENNLSQIRQRISHIKLSCYPEGMVDSKAYFGFEHQWFNPEVMKINKAITPSINSSSSLSVHNTISNALQFLLNSCHQSGWWRDFRSASISLSDEWVTAYVGYVLSLFIDRPMAVTAAQRTWKLLCSIEKTGWGWSAPFAADADSTAWALRLGNQLNQEAHYKWISACQFLVIHQQQSGGISTYEFAYFKDFHRGGDPVKHMLDQWCTPHACVSAAAAHIDIVRHGALNYLLESQNKQGYWSSHWWVDEEFSTALAVEALSTYGTGSQHIERAEQWILDTYKPLRGQFNASSNSVFKVASALKILLCAKQQCSIDLIENMVQWLMLNQLEDGSWYSSARLYSIFDRDNLNKIDMDENRNHTTATVLDALNCYVKNQSGNSQ